MGAIIKRALRRDDPSLPVGVRSPLHIECCGNRVPQAMPPIIMATVCPTCGTAYDERGWVIGNAPGRTAERRGGA